MIATLALPLGMINFIAADSTLMQVTLYDQSEEITRLTGAETVADFLKENGIVLTGYDRTNHAPTSPLWDGMVITIVRGLEFNVQINRSSFTTHTAHPHTTVDQLVHRLQSNHDTSFVYGGDYSRNIVNGELINLYTWDIRFETDVTELAYVIYENHTPNVWKGDSHIRQVGEPGLHEIVTGIIYIGGVEYNRDIVESVVLIEPIDAIIDIGTAPMGALADVYSPDFHYRRRVRMEATAYTSGFSCTGKHPWDPWYGITASGRRVEHGIVAVDRNVIPLGTRLYVEGYGFAIAADVGGAIRGYKIDLFMYNLQDALRFGRRHLYVWILD